MKSEDLHPRLESLLKKAGGWTEIRFHARRSRVLGVTKGEVQDMSSSHYGGVGIRVLVEGTWGFASTGDLSPKALEKTLKDAEQAAHALKSRKKTKVKLASPAQMARGNFFDSGFEELAHLSLEEKFRQLRDAEARIRKTDASIDSASCRYTEMFEDKMVLTSDGANAHIKLARPELRLLAYAADGTQRAEGFEAVGVTGGWNCLFLNHKLEEYIDKASASARTLLKAPPAQGGKKRVILSPAMVGLLCHEAIGHTVEADLVNAGSVAQGKIGQVIASSLVNLCDSGVSEYVQGAGGMIPVDDEGVMASRTYIIKQGKLNSYLHNRETAAQYGVAPTGNARAWEFSNEPLIRMTNTYIEPGTSKLSDMIAEIEDGYFIDGPAGGQADSTGEFMFGATKVRQIRNGKLGDFVQKVTVSGMAFEVLQSIDAVSSDFIWDLGSGYCGKGQPAKVDAGGPYLRCELLIGGA